MGQRRVLRTGTPAEISVLSVMALIGGAGCLASAAFPRAPDAPRLLMTGLALVALLLGVALLLAGPSVSPKQLHVALALDIALVGAMVEVAVTERGLMLSSLGYMWTAVYVAYFFRPRVARIYGALMVIALGVALATAHAPTDASVWFFVSAMIVIAVNVISSLNARLRAEAETDGLTGLLNRVGFAHAAARQRAMAKRRREPVALAIIDLDDFKDVNDREGHAAGDRLLTELAAAWTSCLRPADLLARFGGDEFVVLLPDASEIETDAVLARLARAHPAPWTAGAVMCAVDEPLEHCVHRADERLYGVKESRRRARTPERAPGPVRALTPRGA